MIMYGVLSGQQLTCRPVGFEQLPDHILLKIFRSVEAVPDSTWGSEDSAGAPYGHVTDDTLTALIDGYQKRCGLPLVCNRWNKCLSQPSYVWAHLNIGFHELWDVQQVLLTTAFCVVGSLTTVSYVLRLSG
jgi:hypothetical protein